MLQETVAQRACVPLLWDRRRLVMLCKRSDLSPTDGAELCGCVTPVIQWLGVVWVCVTLSKRLAHRGEANSTSFCTRFLRYFFLFSLAVRWWLHFVCTPDLQRVVKTASFSHENTGARDQILEEISAVKTLLRVSVMFCWKISFPVLRARAGAARPI